MTHTLRLLEATREDYPVIQNMARFYVYDLSRDCGFLSKEWSIPSDGLYCCFDLKSYFEQSTRRAYLVSVDNEIAGFVLLNQVTTETESDWNMGEFFILAKFQGKKIGSRIAKMIWEKHSGRWEIPVIPENQRALLFWHKAIGSYTKNQYECKIKLAREGQSQPYRVIFLLRSNRSGTPSS